MSVARALLGWTIDQNESDFILVLIMIVDSPLLADGKDKYEGVQYYMWTTGPFR
jgi:hypothetical protein